MSGTVNISRGIWHDTAFREEPFTQREAFMWMVMEASYKPRERRVGAVVVNLERGQLATSIRFMAQAWKWTKSRVERFINMLENRDMIGTQTGTGVTIITVCKYDDYQNRPGGAGTPKSENRDSTGTVPGQHRDKPNKGLIPDERPDERTQDTNVSLSVCTDAPLPANDISHAVARYNQAAEKAGWPQVQKLSPNRSKQLRSRLKDCGGAEGWEDALRRAFASDFCRGRTAKPWMGFGFDWLIKSSNFTKLMEGNYDNRSDEHHGPGTDRREPGLADAFAAVALRYENR